MLTGIPPEMNVFLNALARQLEPYVYKKFDKLIGRQIVDIDLQPFDDGRGGFAFNPKITLDDQSVLTFSVTETESGEYGVTLNVMSS